MRIILADFAKDGDITSPGSPRARVNAGSAPRTKRRLLAGAGPGT